MIVVCKSKQKEYKNNYLRQWNKEHQERTMIMAARKRAKRLGLTFNLTPEDIVIPDNCPILGTPIKRNVGSGYWPDNPSLDRIVPEDGYVPENIRVISNRANRIKNDATLEELELITEDLRRIVSSSGY